DSIPSPRSLLALTPMPPLLLAPNTPLAFGTVERPKTPLPPGTPAAAASVASLRAKTPFLALEAVRDSLPSPGSLLALTPMPPLLLAPNTPLDFGTVERPKPPFPQGTPAAPASVASL